jgi:uncharacterized membrane protein
MKGKAMDNVLALTFTDDTKAYEAVSTLKELDSQGQIGLTEASVVVRGEDGRVESKDEVGDSCLTGTPTGRIVGSIVGIIGGPFGILIGGATGLLIGSLFDVHDEDDTESALADMSRFAQAGRTALLGQVAEQRPEVIDTAIAGLGGTAVRRSLDDLEAEIAAAEDAQRKARKAARRRLQEQRHEQLKEKTHTKVEELKAKLHGLQAVGASRTSRLDLPPRAEALCPRGLRAFQPPCQ